MDFNLVLSNLLYLCVLIFWMKKFYYLLLLISGVTIAQQKDNYAIEASVLRGNVLPHRDDVAQLVNGHPEGIMVSFLV